MNLHETKIEWATHTWNPVTGCRHGCEYCYARRQCSRFEPHACEKPSAGVGVFTERGDHPGCYEVKSPVRLVDEAGKHIRSTPYPAGFAPTLNYYTLDYPKIRQIPARIFVSSMGDLFGEWVPEDWIMRVFEACMTTPQHDYLFLTKNPYRYEELSERGLLPAAKNMWYGTTVTDSKIPYFTSPDHHTFISVEPMLGEVASAGIWVSDWVIIGAMTGPGSRNRQPEREWVQEITDACHDHGVPVFMKDSLAPIWGDKLITESPAGMVPLTWERRKKHEKA